MIDLNKCEGGQKRDESGMVMPWYTHPALDEILTWDFKGKSVFEYGCGQSTEWWRKMAFFVKGVDSNKEWAETIGVEFSNDEYEYPAAVNAYGKSFDIIVIDGSWRDECLRPAVWNLNKGGKLIIDNWMQPSVWIPNEQTCKMIAELQFTIFKQPDHYDWQTLIAIK